MIGANKFSFAMSSQFSPKDIQIVLLFGGRSTEHEVSVKSARSIYDALRKSGYGVLPIGIAKNGTWVTGDEVTTVLESGETVEVLPSQATLLPVPTQGQLVSLSTNSAPVPLTSAKHAVVFPVLHGSFGEDGTIQGLFELANLPYVGCGVIGAALGMDKVVQKEIFAYHGIPVARFTSTTSHLLAKNVDSEVLRIETYFNGLYPLFTKPANTGSSVGVIKVKNRPALIEALKVSAQFDRKVIIEEGIEGGREIEVSLLGNHEVKASKCGEIIPAAEFYDYEAKYKDSQTQLKIPAELPPGVEERIHAYAITAFKALCLKGLSRADFFLRGTDLWLNEVNTMPGFTSISMYPKMWEATGVSYTKLVQELVQLALEDWQERQQLTTSLGTV